MSGTEDYQAYLERFESTPGKRKKLDPPDFERLTEENERLKRMMDPDDILLDEWKRIEELRFLLILSEDEEEE